MPVSVPPSSRIPGSFRDPDGFVFLQDGTIYRQVNLRYQENYDYLMRSGLYQNLVDQELLIPHEEVKLEAVSGEAYRILKPEPIPFISYPYEWSFSQLKDAALAVLRIQKKSLRFGLSLKDASAYNIQFRRGKPILIDTLSFEKYREDEPWVAYRQFCQHFLAPLSLMSYRDVRAGQFLRVYPDGIPLDLTSSLLPFWSRLNLGILSHIHLHAKGEKLLGEKNLAPHSMKMTLKGLAALMDHLESSVRKLNWRPQDHSWKNYYSTSGYSKTALEHKKRVVAEWIQKVSPKNIWDLGANTGLFSRLGSSRGIATVAFDADPASVDQNYRDAVQSKETHLLPLWFDLTSPSPNLGWENKERMTLLERGPADLVLALAILHHLAFSNNLPFHRIASFLHAISKFLMIEFVPISDPQARSLIFKRENLFSSYHQEAFEEEFARYFFIEAPVKVQDSERLLYLMRRKETPL